MKKYILFFIFIINAFKLLYSQIEGKKYKALSNLINDFYNNDTIVIWDENYKLQVTDFLSKTKKIKESAFANAYIDIKVKICLSENEMKIYFYVPTCLYKNQSWIHEKMKKDKRDLERTLFHEQIHFDIAELYARKIRKDMIKRLGRVYTNNKIKKLDKIIDKNFNEWSKHNEKFEQETRGLLEDEEKWYENLKNELKKLDKYKTNVVIKKYKKRTLLNLFIKQRNIEYVCDNNTNVMWIEHTSPYTPKPEPQKRKNLRYEFDKRKYNLKKKKIR